MCETSRPVASTHFSGLGLPLPPSSTKDPRTPEPSPQTDAVRGWLRGRAFRSWETWPHPAGPSPAAPAPSWPQPARNPDVSTALTATSRPAGVPAVPTLLSQPRGGHSGAGGGGGEGQGGCLASSDLPGPPFPAHGPNVFDRWRAGPHSAIQIGKQASQQALLDKNASAARSGPSGRAHGGGRGRRWWQL